MEICSSGLHCLTLRYNLSMKYLNEIRCYEFMFDASFNVVNHIEESQMDNWYDSSEGLCIGILKFKGHVIVLATAESPLMIN